jgi:hypothetical protein
MAGELKLGLMTTYELRDRRRALDQALRAADLDARMRKVLEQKLDAVIAEQQERARSRWGGM